MFFQPLAAGSGIPEIKVYLNGVYIKGLLHFKALAAKLCSVMFSISAGLVAGKEGPFVHGGAIVGGGFGSMGSKSFTNLTKGRIQVKAPRGMGGYFRNHTVGCEAKDRKQSLSAVFAPLLAGWMPFFTFLLQYPPLNVHNG